MTSTDNPGDEPGHDVRVYRFAVHGDLPVEAVDEIRRGHDLRNRLVELERAHAERVAAVWATAPELDDLARKVAAASEAVDVVVDAAKKERQRDRTTRPAATTRAALADARRELREAKTALRDAKARLYPAMEPLLADAGTQRRAGIKALYRVAVDGGLYWASYNDVCDHHRTAMRRIAAKRAAGQPADIRFHGWRGEGTIAVQLQRQTGDPPRTPTTIADPLGKWANVACLSPAHDETVWATMSRGDQRRAARGRFRFRVGSGDHASHVEVPVVVHRPIPADADITLIRVTRTRVGTRYKAAISVTVRLPAVPARVEGRRVSAHLGWRALPDGRLRVGVVAGAGRVPDRLRGVAVQHDGWVELVVPASWRRVWERGHSLASGRDKDVDRVRGDVAAWLADHSDVDVGVTPGDVRLWKAPARFAALCLRVRDVPDAVGLYELLEPWRHQDKHLLEWQANERAQILARRKDAYRNVAAWLCAEAAVVVVDGWDVATLRRAPAVGVEDDEQARAARANATFAAPGEMRSAVELAAQARGVTVERPQVASSSTHHVCGTLFDRDEKAAKVMVWCSACELAVDQDWNALQWLLASVAVET